MCTAISVTVGDNYFGRNLDYEHDFGEKVVITPRNYGFPFSKSNGYAIIGMALPMKNYPLYFDATNEMGLSMAGLNFPNNARYNPPINGRDNVASFEIIPWVLRGCKTVNDAEKLLKNANITDEKFAEGLSPTPLHWIIADKERAITVEQTANGLNVYHNPTGVLTNNPPFPEQLKNLENYKNLSAKEPEGKNVNPIEYSRGMGTVGLPGDFSSKSRFVRACFVKENAVFEEGNKVAQFFHLLNSVHMPRGAVVLPDGCEITNYSSCCNADRGIYYYTTYNSGRIFGVDMHRENLDSTDLMIYDIIKSEDIKIQN